MKRIIFLFCIVIIFASCSKDNQNELSQKQKKIDSLELALNKQNIQIDSEKNYLDEAVKLYNSSDFEKAIARFQDFKIKFPNSSYNAEIEIKLKDSKEKLKIQIANSEKDLKDVLKEAKGKDVEEAIKIIEDFIQRNSLKELNEKAGIELEKYKKEFKKVEEERISEKSSGVKIMEVNSYWDIAGTWGDQLFSPHLKIKIKNIGDADIKNLQVKVQFLDKKKGEVFGDDFTYVVGYSDAPLGSGFSKTAFLHSSVGYKSDMAALNLPDLTAKIYIETNLSKESVFFKEVRISKKYNGMDFSK